MTELPNPIDIMAIKGTLLKCIIYGQSGTGKTIFGGGFPGPILLVDSDKGILSLRTTDQISDVKKATIHPIKLEDYSAAQPTTNPQGFDSVKGILEAVVKDGSYKGIKPATVVVDSFTTTSQMCLSRAQYLNGHLGQQPTLPDYGGQRRHLEMIIKLGLALPCHFLAICHEQFLKDEYTGRIWITPMIVGKLAKEIPLYFDEVYYSKVGTSKENIPQYQMECSSSGMITAKSRLGLAGTQELKFSVIDEKLSKLGAQEKGVIEEQKVAGVVGGGLLRD